MPGRQLLELTRGATTPIISHNVYYVIGKSSGGAGLAGCSSCFDAPGNSPGLASDSCDYVPGASRVSVGTAAFQAVRRIVLAWSAIAAGHFASRVDAIRLDSLGIDTGSRHA